MKRWKCSSDLVVIAVAVFIIGILMCGFLRVLNVFANNKYETVLHISTVILIIYAAILQAVYMYYMNMEMSLRTRILAVILTMDTICLFLYAAVGKGNGSSGNHVIEEIAFLGMKLLFVIGFLWVLSARKDISDRQKNKAVADKSTFN